MSPARARKTPLELRIERKEALTKRLIEMGTTYFHLDRTCMQQILKAEGKPCEGRWEDLWDWLDPSKGEEHRFQPPDGNDDRPGQNAPPSQGEESVLTSGERALQAAFEKRLEEVEVFAPPTEDKFGYGVIPAERMVHLGKPDLTELCFKLHIPSMGSKESLRERLQGEVCYHHLSREDMQVILRAEGLQDSGRWADLWKRLEPKLAAPPPPVDSKSHLPGEGVAGGGGEGGNGEEGVEEVMTSEEKAEEDAAVEAFENKISKDEETDSDMYSESQSSAGGEEEGGGLEAPTAEQLEEEEAVRKFKEKVRGDKSDMWGPEAGEVEIDHLYASVATQHLRMLYRTDLLALARRLYIQADTKPELVSELRRKRIKYYNLQKEHLSQILAGVGAPHPHTGRFMDLWKRLEPHCGVRAEGAEEVGSDGGGAGEEADKVVVEEEEEEEELTEEAKEERRLEDEALRHMKTRLAQEEPEGVDVYGRVPEHRLWTLSESTLDALAWKLQVHGNEKSDLVSELRRKRVSYYHLRKEDMVELLEADGRPHPPAGYYTWAQVPWAEVWKALEPRPLTGDEEQDTAMAEMEARSRKEACEVEGADEEDEGGADDDGIPKAGSEPGPKHGSKPRSPRQRRSGRGGYVAVSRERLLLLGEPDLRELARRLEKYRVGGVGDHFIVM